MSVYFDSILINKMSSYNLLEIEVHDIVLHATYHVHMQSILIIQIRRHYAHYKCEGVKLYTAHKDATGEKDTFQASLAWPEERVCNMATEQLVAQEFN